MAAKKVALIWPGESQQVTGFWPPINLGHIASYLEQHGVEVRLLDQSLGTDIAQAVADFRPDIVGLTATTPLAPLAYRLARTCKELGAVTVLGGVHATALPEEALRHCDVVVRGEGERAMLRVVEEGVTSGIVEGEYARNVDELPPPAWHLMDLRRFFQTQSEDSFRDTVLDCIDPGGKMNLLMTTRGCPYRCIFCFNSKAKNPCRFHSPERIISDIEYQMRTYGVTGIHFLDDELFVNKPRLYRICELIRERRLGISWSCAGRVNNIDPKTLDIIRAAGCRHIVIGFESGSQRILDILNKGTRIEQAWRAAADCRRAGIGVYGSFIIGNPTETRHDIELTRRFILQNDMRGLGLNILTPYPGTTLWDWCLEHGRIDPKSDWLQLYPRLIAQHTTVRICDAVSPEELEALAVEIQGQFVDRKGVALLPFLKRRLSRPLDTIKKLVRDPSRVARALRRIRKKP